ncbi:putative proline iminopeptidase [Babylonia areolata]|uniref:putative proline iminopeptidase n=1 Tax=Babylonia areolata TaxID=304850 RepID=UPI003FD1E27A
MAKETPDLRTKYPATKPYDEGWLKVSDIHTLKYWQYGSSTGNPVVFIHGGPGGGTTPCDSRFFDPEAYRIILFDQRGCGHSTPAAELTDNTTWHSVEDIETLRKHLGVDRWLVFGGSWGSTLSLAYAQTHPDRVKALVLRGIFLLRRRELEWFYEDKNGASMIFPDYFEKFRDYIPRGERRDLMGAYYRRLTGSDEEVKLEAAKHWSRWELATSSLISDVYMLERAEDKKWSLCFARIECHYFVNGGFLESDTQLLDNVDKIRHIPATIVQGRYDIVCPTVSAWELHKKWPEADFSIVPDAGHASLEPGTTSLLVQAMDKYRAL